MAERLEPVVHFSVSVKLEVSAAYKGKGIFIPTEKRSMSPQMRPRGFVIEPPVTPTIPAPVPREGGLTLERMTTLPYPLLCQRGS